MSRHRKTPRKKLRVVRPIGPVAGVCWLTDHAARRYRERAGFQGTEGELTLRLESALRDSRPVNLAPGRGVVKFLNHGMRPVQYRLHGKSPAAWILVIDKDVLLTVHHNESAEWPES